MWNHAQRPRRNPTPGHRPVRPPATAWIRRWATLALLTCWVAGCTSTGDRDSSWPGEGFYLDVRYEQGGAVAGRTVTSLLINSGGLALYREASGHLQEPAIPIFSRMAAWQMRDESMRMLSRRLRSAGLFDPTTRSAGERQSPPGGVIEDELIVYWERDGERGQLSTAQAAGDTMERVTHVLNAFLPPDHPLPWPGGILSGDPEPRRLEELPEPVEDLAGSLDFHLELTRSGLAKIDTWLLFHIFALAVADERWDTAGDALLTLRNAPVEPTGAAAPAAANSAAANSAAANSAAANSAAANSAGGTATTPTPEGPRAALLRQLAELLPADRRDRLR